MTGVDQSREEVLTLKRQIFNAKSITKIGTWNVRTLYQCSSMAQVLREMQAYRLVSRPGCQRDAMDRTRTIQQ